MANRFDKEIYRSLDEEMLHGKYAGKTILEVARINGRYLFDSIRRGYIVMTAELHVQVRQEHTSSVKKKIAKTHTENEVSAYESLSKETIKRERMRTRESNEPCIHLKCWCAHHGCKHHGRTTCDAPILHTEGSKEKQYKYLPTWMKR